MVPLVWKDLPKYWMTLLRSSFIGSRLGITPGGAVAAPFMLGGNLKVFWSNGLVGTITTLAIVLLFWPVIDRWLGSVGRLWRPAKA